MIERLEEKVIRVRRRANPKVVSLIFFAIFGFFAVYSMNMTNMFIREKQSLQNEYNRTMYEMIRYIKDVDLNLTKLQIVADNSLIIPTLSNIWSESNLAKESLSNLPVAQEKMENTSKFLTQVSDFSYTLQKNISRGATITPTEYDDIAKLNTSSTQLLEVANNIYDDLNTGRLKWDEVEKVGNQQLDQNVAVANIQSISKPFVEYEGLIYDGAYSEHITQAKPKSLSDTVVTPDQAKDNITKIFGQDNIEYINYVGEMSNKLDLYEFNVKIKSYQNERNIYMTKQDGKLYLMVSDKDVSEQKITVDNAKDIAVNFLKTIGIDSVIDTYYLISENLITINYAAVQDGITLYPDLIKIKIALDDGEVCTVETSGYTFNHVVRTNVTPAITMADAESKISKNVTIKSKNLAIIPTESNNELLVYEFKGEANGKKCIVYVNAITGHEEDVAMIIETPNGTLTM